MPVAVRTIRRFEVAACLAVTVVLGVQFAAGFQSFARPLLAVAFFICIPGQAVAGWLRLEDDALRWTLAIGLSVAAGIVVAQAMLSLHAWDGPAAFWGLAGPSAISLSAQLVWGAPRDGQGREREERRAERTLPG